LPRHHSPSPLSAKQPVTRTGSASLMCVCGGTMRMYTVASRRRIYSWVGAGECGWILPHVVHVLHTSCAHTRTCTHTHTFTHTRSTHICPVFSVTEVARVGCVACEDAHLPTPTPTPTPTHTYTPTHPHVTHACDHRGSAVVGCGTC